ncbi:MULTISPECIES: protein phosphatase 2C domain-containing protein [Nocardia]|uniref:protein phosphatase 2C domain-containing protein n=1 Tax=Nocardia TaxID=1817 RepID=UPI000D698AF7|nr:MULTISPECIES: protein phosphatase 2C domain-containing protein [Nocardia]
MSSVRQSYRGSRTEFDVGAAPLPAPHPAQRGATGHRYGPGDAYVVAAVAAASNSTKGSEVIAQAGVRAVTAYRAAFDHRDDPAYLFELARVALPLHTEFATGTQQHALSAFQDRECVHRRPDTALVVALVTPSGDVHLGWLGNSRAWLYFDTGELLQHTTDHHLTETGSPSLSGNDAPENRHWCRAAHPWRRPTHVVLTTAGVHEFLPPRAIAHALATASTACRAAHWLTRWAERVARTRADSPAALVLRLPLDDPTPGPFTRRIALHDTD